MKYFALLHCIRYRTHIQIMLINFISSVVGKISKNRLFECLLEYKDCCLLNCQKILVSTIPINIRNIQQKAIFTAKIFFNAYGNLNVVSTSHLTSSSSKANKPNTSIFTKFSIPCAAHLL